MICIWSPCTSLPISPFKLMMRNLAFEMPVDRASFAAQNCSWAFHASDREARNNQKWVAWGDRQVSYGNRARFTKVLLFDIENLTMTSTHMNQHIYIKYWYLSLFVRVADLCGTCWFGRCAAVHSLSSKTHTKQSTKNTVLIESRYLKQYHMNYG